MGHKMALSFKNNERDKALVKVIQGQRDKSNFIKDAIEFYIKYKHLNLTEYKSIENNSLNNIRNLQEEKPKENIKAALQFMKLDDD